MHHAKGEKPTMFRAGQVTKVTRESLLPAMVHVAFCIAVVYGATLPLDVRHS